MPRSITLLATCLLAFATTTSPAQLIVPESGDETPVFGVRDGILVALHPGAFDARPDGGPRGLLRIGVEHEGARHLLNYLAIEPIVEGKRGLSELERGADGAPGLRFEWVRPPSSDSSRPGTPWIVESGPDGRSVRVGLRTERFANGARPIVEVTLFEERPHELRLRTFAAPGSAPMEALVLTSSMGNQSRCRELWLKDDAVHAHDLFRAFGGNGFADHAPFGLDRLHRAPSGAVVAVITPDETEPREVRPLANGAWRCTLPWCGQFWRKPADGVTERLRVRVNGRRVYWAGRTPIPGGASIENFELLEPFRPGAEQWFGYTFESPKAQFEFAYDRPPRAPVERVVPKAEATALRDAAQRGRRLDASLAPDLGEWHADGGASSFRIFEVDGRRRLTTHGARGDDDTGRLWQCFVVPDDARDLRLWIHGGCDRARLRVALWDGARRHRAMTGRDDNRPFEVRWDVRSLRGRAVTLEVVDEQRGPWGFVGVHGIELMPDP